MADFTLLRGATNTKEQVKQMNIRIKCTPDSIRTLIERDCVPAEVVEHIVGRTIRATIINGNSFQIKFPFAGKKAYWNIAADCVEVEQAKN